MAAITIMSHLHWSIIKHFQAKNYEFIIHIGYRTLSHYNFTIIICSVGNYSDSPTRLWI